MLWHNDCIGKLKRLGILLSYLNWVENWLSNRKRYIEINRCRSRWFAIEKGGPQSSVLTPTIFISYHCDMYSFLAGAMSHMFATIVSGQIGLRFTEQCIDLDQLVLFSFSWRAITKPKFNLVFSSNNSTLTWTNDYKYLGYTISRKLGFILITKAKVMRSISLIKSFKIFGCSSPKLCLVLFYTFVFPIFSWIFSIFPLFTSFQQRSLSHFYYASIRRLLSCLHFNSILFSYCLDFSSLEDRCFNYWTRFLFSLSDSIDGDLFLEQAIHASFRIKCLHRNERLLRCSSILETVMSWLS